MSALKAEVTPERPISLIGAVSIGIGGMVGGGIFAVLGVVAVQARGGAPLAFVIAGVVAVLTAYSYARLSVAYPSRGGTVVYLDRAFEIGLATGTLNNLLWMAYLVTLSLYAVAFANYGATFASGTSSSATIHILISVAIIGPTLLNLLNASIVARTETAVVSVKLGLLAMVGVAGAGSISGSRLAVDTWPAIPSIAAAGMLIFVAYEGFELIANAAEDVRRPAVNLPRAFFWSVGVVLLLYVLIAVVTVGSLAPATLAGAADFALSQAAEPSLGVIGFRIVAASAVFATFSAINATLYGAARLSFSIAAEGELPPALERDVWHQPVGLLVTSACALILANTLDLGSIASIASASFLIIFAAVNAAAWRKAREIGASRLLTALATLGCLASVGVLLQQTVRTDLLAVIVLAALIATAAGAESFWLRSLRGACRPSRVRRAKAAG
jgi:amino acid transporter